MSLEKLSQDLIFAKKLVNNTLAVRDKNKPGSDVYIMLNNQLERLQHNVTELEFLMDVAQHVAKTTPQQTITKKPTKKRVPKKRPVQKRKK